MKFIEVDEYKDIYERRRYYKKGASGRVIKYVEEFMSMNIKAARVEFEDWEYTSSLGCYSAFRQLIFRRQMPIDLKMADGEVYLIRTDI